MRVSIAPLVLVALCGAMPARADLFAIGSSSSSGDLRLRAESDWDSRDRDGEERDDRTRLRVRLRLAFVFEPSEHLRAEVRLRTGSEDSQQSPHLTLVDFGGADTGDVNFGIDRWYLRGATGGFEIWAGRHDLPFWKQNEFLLDEDATMPGIGLRQQTELDSGSLSLAAGYYALPVGMKEFAGNLAAAQLAYQPEIGGVRLSLAGGIYDFDADRRDPDGASLLQGNGGRDYLILAGSVQALWQFRDRPLVVGADLMNNATSYAPSDPDPFTAAHHDETGGYAVVARWGSLAGRGDWLLGYSRARIEALAVHNSYAQDDWVRWGSATQTRGSDLQGHELRFGWSFDEGVNLLVRFYLVESITTVEDGKRFRIDFNYRF